MARDGWVLDVKNHRVLGDRLFGPGLIYIMSGWRDDDAAPIYKIGATTQDPHIRAKQIQEGHLGLYPIRVLHFFPVDNMRVIESMLHTRYAHRCLESFYTHEWFDIDDEVYDMTQCTGIYVNNCLSQLSGNRNARKWWMGLRGEARVLAELRLWMHPALKIGVERWF